MWWGWWMVNFKPNWLQASTIMKHARERERARDKHKKGTQSTHKHTHAKAHECPRVPKSHAHTHTLASPTHSPPIEIRRRPKRSRHAPMLSIHVKSSITACAWAGPEYIKSCRTNICTQSIYIHTYTCCSAEIRLLRDTCKRRGKTHVLLGLSGRKRAIAKSPNS